MKIIYTLIAITILASANYNQMLTYEQQNKPLKVIQEAKHSFKEYNNPKLHLLWAESAEKLNKLDEAMSAYERVLIIEPNNKKAQTALQNIYTKTKREGLVLNPYAKANNNIFKVKASVSLGYDSNINVNPSGSTLDSYYGVELGIDEISTNFTRATAELSYVYHLEQLDNWFIQSSLNAYYQNNSDAHLYDLTVPTFTLAMGYQTDSYLFYFPLSYSNIHYLDKNLLDKTLFAPKIRFSILENSLLDIGAFYEKRVYNSSKDSTKDASSYGIETGLYYSTDTIRTHFNARYEKRTAQKSSNEKFVDASFFTLDADIKYYFTPFISTAAHYLFRYSDYSDDIGSIDTPSRISRDDYINQVKVQFTYAFNKNVETYISDTFTDSLSSYLPTEYNKNELMLGFNVRY